MNWLHQDPGQAVAEIRAGAEHALAMARGLSPTTPGASCQAETLAATFDALHRRAAFFAQQVRHSANHEPPVMFHADKRYAR